jgi:hypothetical protein
MPPGSGNKSVREFAKQAMGAFHEHTKQLAIAIVDAVAEHTPVDTGRARSNWQVGIGKGKDNEIEPYAPGQHLGRGESANLSAVMSAARSELAAYKGGDIVITNNVDYMEKLDKGSSTQSPGDFIGVAMAIVGGGAEVGDDG